MEPSRAGNDAAASRRCGLRMRPDLSALTRTRNGRNYWRIKDPISLRYYELSEEEYVVLTMLDGKVTLAQLKETIEKRFPPRITSHEELQSLLFRFHELGLVFGEGAAQTEAAQKARSNQMRSRWLGSLANPLFLKLPGFDPEPILRWLYPPLSWMFGPIPLLACLGLVLTAVALVAVQFDLFMSKLPSLGQLFQAGNFIWLMLAITISKSLHELGHAFTCRHFGGECHEIGPAFLLLSPSLYCDTTDAWMIPSKWRRAAVGAAGMAVELVLASMCVIVWRFTQPGLLQFLCLNTILVCSVSTLVFNGNPLLRFDGYYILSDLLDIPNLWQKSRAELLRLLRIGALGLPSEGMKTTDNKVLLIGYGIASVANRVVVVIGIVLILSKALRPYGLQVIGQSLLAMTLIGMVAAPAWKIGKFFRRPGVWRRVKLSFLLTSCSLTCAIIAGILFVPIPHHVFAPLVTEPRTAERIYATEPGILEDVYVEPGDQIVAGAPIAKLTNLEINLESCRLAGERDRLRTNLQNLLRRQGHDKDAADMIPFTKTSLADLEERSRRRKLNEQRLQLVAHQTGVVLPPPRLTPATSTDGDLPAWTGLPCDPRNRGCYLEVGTLVCLVSDPSAMDALLIVDQNDVEFVQPGQKVTIKLDEYRASTFEAEITQVSAIDLDQVPAALSHKAGGELSTLTDKSGRERPIRVAYQVRVPLPKSQWPVFQGFLGRGKIDVGRETLGRRLLRTVRQTFLF